MEDDKKLVSAADEINELAIANDVAKEEKIDAGNYYFSKDKRFQFIEKSLHERGFAEFFEKNVKPEVLKLEQNRLNRVKWLFIRTIALLSFMFFIKEFVHQLTFLEAYTFEYYVVMPILAILIAAHPERNYKADYKNVVLPIILKFFNTLSYNVEGKIEAERLRNSDILPPYTRYDSEDMIHGSYHGSKLTLTEVRIFDSHNPKQKTNKFSGLFILLEMDHMLKGKTIIRKDMGFKGKWNTGKISEKQKISLIEERFSRRFKVYTTDIDEANKIISPSLLEIFMNLSGRFKNTTMEGCFYENKVFITIPCYRNLFEPASIFMPAYNIKDLRLLIEEISLLFKLLDTVKNIKNII